MDCSPPGSSVRGIFQARVLEWVAIAFSIIIPVSPPSWASLPPHPCYSSKSSQTARLGSLLLYSNFSPAIYFTHGDQPWVFFERNDAKLKLQYFGHLMQRVDSLEKTWCWEGLGAGGEGEDRGWDGWMASPTRWTWVWVNSGGWWWTGRPGVLRFMGWQRVGHDWATELNWTECIYVDATFSTHYTLSFPHCVHKSILYICIFILSLQTGSSIPFFYIPYIHVQFFFSLSNLLNSV